MIKFQNDCCDCALHYIAEETLVEIGMFLIFIVMSVKMRQKSCLNMMENKFAKIVLFQQCLKLN